MRLGCLLSFASTAACAQGISGLDIGSLANSVGNGAGASTAGSGNTGNTGNPDNSSGGGPPQIAGGATGSSAGADTGTSAGAANGGSPGSGGGSSGGGPAGGGSSAAGAPNTTGMCGHFQPGNMGPTLQSKLEGATDSVYFTVEIDNPDDRDVHVADLKYRYYLDTSDLGTLMTDVYLKQIKDVHGTTREVDVAPTVTFADTYFEVSFAGSSSLVSSGESLQVKLHVHNSMYKTHDQTTDYSFNPSTTLVPWCHIVLYELAPVAWGNPPP